MTGLHAGFASYHDVSSKMSARQSGVGRTLSVASRGSASPDQRQRNGDGRPTSLILGERIRGQSPGRIQRSPSTTHANQHGVRGATPKMPKAPRPVRATLIFTSLKKGLCECVGATEEDIVKLRECCDMAGASSTGQGKAHDIEKQIKAAERYKKRLEFHLAKVEELEEDYMLQQQLREGAKNMARAYITSPTTHQKESIGKVKDGYKECTQTMCSIEAQLETMLGTFHCQMKGMSGFARLAPGDVFEVSVRYGSQKWKTKGRIGVSHQSWENNYTVFKSLVGDVFTMKAVEVRGLGRTVLLGRKNCETKDLFSSHPQLMTVNINTNGSLKLSVVITWSPLEAMEENITFYEPLPKSQSTKRRSYPSAPSSPRPDYSRDSPMTSPGTEAAINRRSLPSRSPPKATDVNRRSFTMAESPSSPSFTNNHVKRPKSVAVMGNGLDSINDSLDIAAQRPRLFDMRMMAESVNSVSADPHRTDEVRSLEECVYAVSTVLEDFRGQYQELAKLEEAIIDLQKLIRKHGGAGSGRSSSNSISIQNALGAFDFLECEDYLDFASRQASLDQMEASSNLSPRSTAQTADSGIASLKGRLHDDDASHGAGMNGSSASSPDPASTGNEQADMALCWHLGYCERLLENLGNFGPLKCREIYSVEKLRKQADILEDLIHIAKDGPILHDIQSVLARRSKRKDVRSLWLRCSSEPALYIPTESFIHVLDVNYSETILERYDTPSDKVFAGLLARILDVASFDPSSARQARTPVTLHSVAAFFQDDDVPGILDYVLQLAGELWVSERLRSGDTDLIIKTTLSFRESLPPAECMRIAALLLITEDKEVRDTISYYLRGLGSDPRLRDKAIITFVEALEDRSADVRCAACLALKLLSAVESMDQLVYVCHSDSSHMVRTKAKETLMSFGDEGRRAFQQSQLTSHGFQGIHINH